jgi:hypothetical protein
MKDRNNDLMVTRGHDAGREVVVLFFRVGSGFYPCKVAKEFARQDAYLRRLIIFMQHKVPRR